jgi:hypothetical protein
VVFARLEDDAVARPDQLDAAAFPLAETDAFGDPDRLPVRMGVPGSARIGVKWTLAAPIRDPSDGAAMVST